MFDFEEWSQKVYELVETEDENQQELNRKQLQALWKEMMDQKGNPYVSFLDHLLSNTKGVIEGQVPQSDLNRMVDEMREKVLTGKL